MNTKMVVRIAVLSAILCVIQLMISYLPNIEFVTLLLIVFSLHLPLKEGIWICIVFSTMQGLLYGFHLWTLMYYVIWSFYCVIVYVLKNRLDNWVKVAVLASVFGFAFGSLHSIPYFFIGGVSMGKANIIAGLLFDLVHGVGNFVIATVLFDSVNKYFNRYIDNKRN